MLRASATSTVVVIRVSVVRVRLGWVSYGGEQMIIFCDGEDGERLALTPQAGVIPDICPPLSSASPKITIADVCSNMSY